MEHPYAATIFNNIGLVCWSKGEVSKAIDYYNKSLIIDEAVFGENHIETASVYLNIGVLYSNIDPNIALVYLNKALTVFQQKLGQTHINTRGAKEWIDKVNSSITHAPINNNG